MTQGSAHRLPPQEIPQSFFEALPDPVAVRGSKSHVALRPNPIGPMKALILYDHIIDYMLQHPDCHVTDVAKHLGKANSTISHVVRSDFFRALYLKRREQFSEQLAFRLQNKMLGVVEKSLDLTKEALDTRQNIPLSTLNEINEGILDRLGYSPRGGSVTVAVQNNNTNEAAPGAASPAGVAAARAALEKLEAANATSGALPGNTSAPVAPVGPVVEGEAVRLGDAS